ncbi:hypothetical protein [Amedibacillus sp. YH-ame10]
MLIELYNQLNKGRYNNHIDSQYWIYSIENIITKENGVSKRYLKILFFNRKMNESNNLMRLYLNINGKEVEQDLFSIVSEYNNPSVLGFIKELDLIEEGKDARITGYVIDGKKINVSRNIIDYIEINSKQKELSALKEYYFTNDVDIILFPSINDSYWLCTCGYCNDKDDLICPICVKKKADIQNILKIDIQQLVLSQINSRIQVHAEASVFEIIETYKTALAEKYGIDTSDTEAAIDVDQLIHSQNKFIENRISEFIRENKVVFDIKKSFEDTINDYCHQCITPLITKDMIVSQLDIEALKEQYKSYLEKYKKQKNRNKHVFILYIIAAFLISSVYIGYSLLSKDKYKGVETKYNKEYRENVCSKTIENTLYNDEDKENAAKAEFLCNFDVDDEKIDYPKSTKDGDKEIKALDEDHVLIKKTEDVDNTHKKVYYYISDLNGQIVYDNSEDDYYYETYDDQKIMKSEIIRNSELVQELTWDYTNDKDYVISTYDHIEDYETSKYYYENDILVQQVSPVDPLNGSGLTYDYDYVYKYNYEDGVLKVVSLFAGNTLIENHYYEQNRIKRIMQVIDGHETLSHSYYYDTNGFMIKNKDPEETVIYSHDFDNGMLCYAAYENSSSNPILIFKGKMFFNPDLIAGYDKFTDLSWILISYYTEVY